MNGKPNEKKNKNIYIFKETIVMWFSTGTGIRSLKGPFFFIPFWAVTLR
jgi:hypothetical protein